jgi:hypothetical protein
MQASKQIVEKNSNILSNLASFKDWALSKTLCPVDAEIAKLCKKIKCC